MEKKVLIWSDTIPEECQGYLTPGKSMNCWMIVVTISAGILLMIKAKIYISLPTIAHSLMVGTGILK